MPRFSALDGLRGLAALAVAYLHYSRLICHVTPYRGGLPVDLFFLLSGFVLAYVYQDRLREGRVTVLQFVGHRFARLYPVHLVVLLPCVILLGLVGYTAARVTPDLPFFPSLLCHLVMAENLVQGQFQIFNPPMWSVAVEWWVNMGWVLLVCLCSRLPRPYLTWIAGVIVIVYLFQIGGSTGFDNSNPPYSWTRGVFGFFLGTLLYQGWLRLRDAKSYVQLANVLILPTLALICAGSLLTPQAPLMAAVVIGCPLLILASVAPGSLTQRFFSTRPLVWLGEISYSLYLWHYPTYFFLVYVTHQLGQSTYMAFAQPQELPGQIVSLTLLFLLAFALSICSYYILEVPARTVLKRRADSWWGRVAQLDK